MQAIFQSAHHIYEKMEGYEARSGSAPLTNRSGSRRPKNMRFWIQFQIRIPNTGSKHPPPLLERLCEPPGGRCRLTECLSEDNTRDLIRVLIEADRAIGNRKVVHHWISLTFYSITYRIHKEKQQTKVVLLSFFLLQNT